jgi:hypothetical protein
MQHVMSGSAESKQKTLATDVARMNTDENEFIWIAERIVECACKVARRSPLDF